MERGRIEVDLMVYLSPCFLPEKALKVKSEANMK